MKGRRKGHTVSVALEMSQEGAGADAISSALGITREGVRVALVRAGHSELAAQLFPRRPGPTHGLPSTYVAYGCRCEPCTGANRERTYKTRARLSAMDAERVEVPHGRSRYNNYGCRCDICRGAQDLAVIERMRFGRGGPNDRKRWTAEDLAYVTERDENHRYLRSAKECAEKLGRSVSSVDGQRSLSRRSTGESA